MSDTPGAIRRTIVFGLALLVLLWVARQGAPTVLMQVAFSVFIAVSAIWLRGQYADSLDNHQWVIPSRWGLITLAVAIGLLVTFLVATSGGYAIAAVLLVYFLAGSAMTELRQSDKVTVPMGFTTATIRPMRWGPPLTIAGIVLLVAGLAVFGRNTGTGWLIVEIILLGVPLVLLLPIGLSLLSERTMRWLSQPGDRAVTWRLWFGIGGAVLFLGMTGLAVALSGSISLLVVMVVIGSLVAALVSSTHADIVAVMAVVALLGVTPAQTAPSGRMQATGGSRVLVALGDSYMSGEGASIYFEGTDEGDGNQCRRSPTSWVTMAAQLAPFDRLEFRACSGARTANVLPQQPTAAGTRRPQAGNPPPSVQPGEGETQLDAYRHDHVAADGTEQFIPGLVVLSIGGNDAGFSTIGVMCLAPGNCSDKAGLWTSSLDQVRARLRATYYEVDAAFPDTPVVVVPYPDPIKLGNACGQVALSARERQFIHTFLAGDDTAPGLNDVIEQTAQEFGFYYLAEMQDALAEAHLQLCDPLNEGRPGLHFVGLRSVRGIAEQRFNPMNWSHSSLHPNERGHAAMLRVFQTWMAEQPLVMATRTDIPQSAKDRLAKALDAQAGTSADAANQTAAAKAPQCDLFDPTPKGCRPQGQQWASRQVAGTMLAVGWIALLAAAGAWAAAVALFGWRREPWPYSLPAADEESSR